MLTVQGKSLVDPEIRRCPWEFYRELQENSPVYLMPGTDFYFVSDYDIALQVFRDSETFSSETPAGQSSYMNFCPEADKLLAEKGYGRRGRTIPMIDPPDHARLRKAVTDSLRPTIIRGMEPAMRSLVKDLFRAIPGDGVHDIVKELIIPLPMYVLSDWMGLERSDYERFKQWSAAANYTLQPPLPKETLLRYAELIAEMQHHFIGLMEERRTRPREDLITYLLNVDPGGQGKLTQKEILSLLETLLVGAQDTTINALGNGMLILARDQALQSRLRQEPSLIPRFVEEVLRTESSVVAMFRRAKKDVELAGVAIPAGAKILVGIAAANRDQKKFVNPDQVDLDRRNINDHFAFGSGIHTCAGNTLARLEMRLFFEMFLKEFESATLAMREEDIRYHNQLGLRGLVALQLDLVHAKPGGEAEPA